MQWLVEVLGTSMDGYGIYVWPAFLICALVMLVLAMTSLRALRRAEDSFQSLDDNET